MCGLPTWLDISLEQAKGPSYRIVLEGVVLEYRVASDGTTWSLAERIRPRAQQWRDFLTALEAAGCWHWASEYRGEDVLLPRWSVEIAAPFRQLSSTGAGALPPGEAFHQFCAAVRLLLDGRAFGDM